VSAEVAEWNALPGYWHSPPLSNVIGRRGSNVDDVARQTTDVDDEASPGDWLDVRRLLLLPKLHDESSGSPRVTRRAWVVDGSFAHPDYSGIAADSQRGRVRGLSDTASDWRRSASNGVVLDAALSRLEERIGRRRLFDKWFEEV